METQGNEDPIERMAKISRIFGNSSANIHVHAGGVALWISVTCCAVMLSYGILGTVYAGLYISAQNTRISDQNRKIERMQDYLNEIYMIAPQLRPKETKR